MSITFDVCFSVDGISFAETLVGVANLSCMADITGNVLIFYSNRKWICSINKQSIKYAYLKYPKRIDGSLGAIYHLAGATILEDIADMINKEITDTTINIEVKENGTATRSIQ